MKAAPPSELPLECFAKQKRQEHEDGDNMAAMENIFRDNSVSTSAEHERYENGEMKVTPQEELFAIQNQYMRSTAELAPLAKSSVRLDLRLWPRWRMGMADVPSRSVCDISPPHLTSLQHSSTTLTKD